MMGWRFIAAGDSDLFWKYWEELNPPGVAPPLLNRAYIYPRTSYFASGEERLAVCEGLRGPLALALLAPEQGNAWVRLLAPMHIGIFSMAQGEDVEALLQSLMSVLRGSLAVTFANQDPDVLPRPANASSIVTRDCTGVERISIQGNYGDYWSTRGAALKDDIARWRNRLSVKNIVPRLEVVTEKQQIARSISEFGNLDYAGKKRSAGTAVHPNSTYGWFYRATLDSFCDQGGGRVFRYWFNEKLAAMALGIEANGRLIVLRTTFDSNLDHLFPASLMRRAMIEHVFGEKKIGTIEFHESSRESQGAWTDDFKTPYDIRCYRWPWLSRLGTFHRSPTSIAADIAGAKGAVIASSGAYTITVRDNLSALSDHNSALFDYAGKSSVFHTLEWYRTYIRSVLSPNDHLRIYTASPPAGSDQAHCALLMRHGNLGNGRWHTRILSGLSNYYTSLFGPVIGPDIPILQSLLDALASGITRDTASWDVVDMHPMSADSPVLQGLITAFRRNGMLVARYFCFGNWYLKVENRSYAQYFESLPSQLKHTITRKKRQLEKAGGSRIVICRDSAGLDTALDAYRKIYASSWKVPEPYPEFIANLAHTCTEAGWLRLGIAYVNNEPAAAQLWVVTNGIANIYKLAYDERYARLSLGTILTAHLMEYVIDVDKVREVDYLTGDDAYKKDWMSDRRERFGMVAFNLRSPRGLFAAMRHLLGRLAKGAIDLVHGLLSSTAGSRASGKSAAHIRSGRN
jgi:Acetyltransferase (GNAT) domain